MNPIQGLILAVALLAATVHGQTSAQELPRIINTGPPPIKLVADDPPALPDTEAGPIETTLCEIVKHPLRFHKRLVRIRATAQGPSIATGYMLSTGRATRASMRRTIIRLGGAAEASFTGRVEYFLGLTPGESTIHFALEAVSDLTPGRTCSGNDHLPASKRIDPTPPSMSR